MFDLGRTIFNTAERNPRALAIVDGKVRLTYEDWVELIGRIANGLRALGLEPGDHVVTILQNRWQMATIYWACQVARLIVTPLNWRFTSDELNYCLTDANARAVVFEAASAAATAAAVAAVIAVAVVVCILCVAAFSVVVAVVLVAVGRAAPAQQRVATAAAATYTLPAASSENFATVQKNVLRGSLSSLYDYRFFGRKLRAGS